MVHSAATCWYSSYAWSFLPSICVINTATHAHFLNISYSCFCNHYDVNNAPHNSSVVMTDAQALMTYPAGSGPIYLDNVACSGSELTLVQCSYDTHTADCVHREDAGVRCIRKLSTRIPYIAVIILFGTLDWVIFQLSSHYIVSELINNSQRQIAMVNLYYVYCAHKMHEGQNNGK